MSYIIFALNLTLQRGLEESRPTFELNLTLQRGLEDSRPAGEFLLACHESL